MDKLSTARQSIHHMLQLQRETDASVASQKGNSYNSNIGRQIFINIFNVYENIYRKL
jgi:hypothetical protein